MPEFHLDTSLDRERWEALDDFTKGYVEAMFFTEYDELGETGFHDLADETLDAIKANCVAFNTQAAPWLRKAYDRDAEYTELRAGHDFWLTRNHHGAGFWDRGLGPAGERLTTIAHSFGSADAYLGDDGKVYVQ